MLFFFVSVISLSLLFLCNLLALILMHPRYLQCWLVLFRLLSLTYNLFMSPLGCKVWCIVISFLVLWSICQKSFHVPFQEWSRVSYKGNSPGFNPFDELPSVEVGFEKLSHSLEILLYKERFPYYQVLVGLLFSKRSSYYYYSYYRLFPWNVHLKKCHFNIFTWHTFKHENCLVGAP